MDISERAGPGILGKHSARGLALADIDGDGTLEVLINNQGEPPSLLRQTTKPGGHWVTLKLEGVKANRSAIGAKVRLTTGGVVQTAEVRSGGGYLSQSDFRLHFGMGGAVKVDQVEITWPGGAKQVVRNVAADRVVVLREE